MAFYRLGRLFRWATTALCLAPMFISAATTENRTNGTIGAGTLVWFERSTVDDVMAIVRDLEAEDPARRLMLILSSGECSDHLVGERYEAVSVEQSGIIKARVRGFSNAHLVPLVATGTDALLP